MVAAAANDGVAPAVAEASATLLASPEVDELEADYAKIPRHPKTLFGAQWTLEAAGRRAALQHHGRFGPRQRLADRRGNVDGPRTQLDHPHPGTWAPTAMGFGRGVDFTPKIRRVIEPGPRTSK
jgi:hypothetical protein